MGNEESKRVAAVVVALRKLAIAQADYTAVANRLKKFYEDKE